MTLINAQRLNGPFFTDVMRFARLPDRIVSSLGFFNRNQEHMVVRMVIIKKMFRNCCIDVTTVGVNYWSPVLIEAVFEAQRRH